MKAYATLLAALLLGLTPWGWAEAQPGRGGRGGGGRVEAPRGSPGGYRGPAYGPSAPRPYGYPPPAPYAYPPAPYAPPPAYRPPPGYVPNSLGADWAQQQDQARRGVRRGALMPMGQILTMIRRSTPGRPLDAGIEPGPDGRPAYRVRWAAKGGRRIDFIVDAATGAILRRTGD
jgi:hypothetical protein